MIFIDNNEETITYFKQLKKLIYQFKTKKITLKETLIGMKKIINPIYLLEEEYEKITYINNKKRITTTLEIHTMDLQYYYLLFMNIYEYVYDFNIVFIDNFKIILNIQFIIEPQNKQSNVNFWYSIIENFHKYFLISEIYNKEEIMNDNSKKFALYFITYAFTQNSIFTINRSFSNFLLTLIVMKYEESKNQIKLVFKNLYDYFHRGFNFDKMELSNAGRLASVSSLYHDALLRTDHKTFIILYKRYLASNNLSFINILNIFKDIKNGSFKTFNIKCAIFDKEPFFNFFILFKTIFENNENPQWILDKYFDEETLLTKLTKIRTTLQVLLNFYLTVLPFDKYSTIVNYWFNKYPNLKIEIFKNITYALISLNWWDKLKISSIKLNKQGSFIDVKVDIEITDDEKKLPSILQLNVINIVKKWKPKLMKLNNIISKDEFEKYFNELVNLLKTEKEETIKNIYRIILYDFIRVKNFVVSNVNHFNITALEKEELVL